MKQFNKKGFSTAEDIQIQVPTARLCFSVILDEGIELSRVKVRGRMVSAGTRTIIERMSLQELFEIAAQSEGFFRSYAQLDGTVLHLGHVDIARGGSLALSNSSYVSLDVSAPGEMIAELTINSLQLPTTTTTYLYYNPVTITQALQNVPLDRAVAIVIPEAKISEIQLVFPSNAIPYTRAELKFIGDMSNDLVSVHTSSMGQSTAVYGYGSNFILSVKDATSGESATRMQVEQAVNGGQFNIYLVEEKSL